MTPKEWAEKLWPEIAKRFTYPTAGAEGAVTRLVARSIAEAVREERAKAIFALGSAGGKAAAGRMTPAERSKRAKKAALARWKPKR